MKKKFHSDVSFIGTGYDPSRAQFLLKIAKKYDLKVWGRGWEEWRKPLHWGGRPVEGKEFAAVCSSSSISLGIAFFSAAGTNLFQAAISYHFPYLFKALTFNNLTQLYTVFS